MDPSMAGPGNKTVAEGAAFDLPDMQFSSSVLRCIAFGTGEFRVYSFGYFAGEKTYSFPFPVLMFQITSIIFVTRVLYALLRPLKQPRIVCNVIGGLLLSPGVFGLIKINFTDRTGRAQAGVLTDLLFPKKDFAVIRTVTAVGVMFHLFLIGVKIDPKMIVSSGKRAWGIGIVSFIAPFVTFGIACLVLGDDLSARILEGRFLIFVVASISITSFPVLADILAELHLLNSELGRLAMSSSIVHGVFGSVFMSTFIAINQGQGGWEKSLWALLSLAAVIVIIVFVFRPWMLCIIKRTPKGGQIDEKHIFTIFVTVIAIGIVSDSIGASFAFAPFIMGLAIPDGPPLGAALVEKAHLLAGEAMMPLVFAVMGMSTDLVVFKNWRKWVGLTLVLLIGYVAKVVGTMVPAIYYKIPAKNAFLLGLMMNFRGLVEILTLLHFKAGALFVEESYTLFLLVTILGTSVAVPLVSTFYKPLVTGYNIGHRTIQHLKAHAELRVLTCIQSENPIPSIINLLEASSPANEMPLCVYVLHLTELVGRASSALIAHKNKKGFINPSQMDRLHNVFINYEQNKRGHVTIQPFTSITPIKTMHQDICSLAAEKNVALIIIPFQRKDGTILTNSDQAIRSNIPNIQAQAPCSIGILVCPDVIGTVTQASGQFQQQVGALFWGGPDDREALAYASRMACRTGINLTVFYFMLPADQRDIRDQKLDDHLLANIQYENANNNQFIIERVVVKDVEQTIQSIRSIGSGYNLLLVGRKQGANSLLDKELEEWSEYPELGVVGDMLASKDFEGSNSSILVVQQQA